jgi:hypothetical protein
MMINTGFTRAQLAGLVAVSVVVAIGLAALGVSRSSDRLSSHYTVAEGASGAIPAGPKSSTSAVGRVAIVDHLVASAPPTCLDDVSGSAPIRNCAEVTIIAGHGINLDSQTASWDADSPGSDNLTFYGPNLDNSLPGKGLVEQSSSGLTYAICAATTASDFHGSVDLTNAKKGTTFCARTPLDHYAAIRLLTDWTPLQVRLLGTTWQPTG